MSTPGIQIRALEPEDYVGWAALRNCPNVLRNTLGLPLSGAFHSRRILEGTQDRYHSVVAIMDGQIVGWAGVELLGRRRAHVGRPGVMVQDDYARRGIGAALLSTVLDIADNWLNLHRLELEVYTDNLAAIRLYERFGFEIEGTLREFAYGDGRYLDVYAMARLRPRP